MVAQSALHAQKAISLDSGRINAWLIKAKCAAYAGDSSQAIEDLQALLLREPKHADAHHMLALGYFEMGSFDRAAGHARKAGQYGLPLPGSFLDKLRKARAE